MRLNAGWTLIGIAATALSLAACQNTAKPDTYAGTVVGTHATPVIPRPVTIVPRSGRFTIGPNARVVVAGDDPQARRIARDFVGRVQRSLSLAPALDLANQVNAPAIVFALNPQANVAADEGYVLDIKPDGTRIEARTPAGLFYGSVTLWQLATTSGVQAPASIPAQRIEDAPRFAWRGLMLDVARHFRSVDEVKLVIDQMALHKLNTFHWHLTDDQGWRIEIKHYPRLTEVGGCRVLAGENGRDPKTRKPTPYCGYYTQEQIRDVVKYAADRFVTVVPEIEMPGHAQAAIASYPKLGVTDVVRKAPPVSPDWGIHTYLFNVEDGTFEFLKNVLNEVVDLFPSRYIHVGGDEAAKDQWIASRQIQARKKALGLKDENALQSWFITRVEGYLSERGRVLVGWDEILEGGKLPPSATVMSWRGTGGAVEAAREGHDVILAPDRKLYLDYVQSDTDDEPPGRFPVATLKDFYDFEPVPPELTPEQAHHVLGAQGNLWTEHRRTMENVERSLFPRTAALAEVVWSPKASRNWDDFLARLAPQMVRYRQQRIAASDAAFAVRYEARSEGNAGAGTPVRLSLSNQAGFGDIRFTRDGSEPHADDELYRGPIEATLPVDVVAATFVGREPLSAPRRYTANDAAALTTRSNAQLRTCSTGFNLRLEDDAPADGVGGQAPRAAFKTHALDPCWFYDGAQLDGVGRIEVRVGQVPYNFQLWHDTKNIVTRKATVKGGALEVRVDSCEGKPVAVLPLAPARKSAGLTTLEGKLPALSGEHVLCLVFASGRHDPLWAIDRVTLHPRD